MSSVPISINAPRPAPTAAYPISATINPEIKEGDNKTESTRVVSGSERVDNPTLDQTREQNSQNQNNLTELTPDEQRVLEQLKARDREVRAHEQAHLAAAGNLATSGASFTYQQGPDGQRYAVGGEVGIESAVVPGDPEATAARAQQIRRAALAPANPSAQDRSVAVAATATEQKAQAELAKQVQEERGQSAVSIFNDIAATTGENEGEDNRATPTIVDVNTFA